MPRHRVFYHGDSASKLLEANYLNTIEARLKALEGGLSAAGLGQYISGTFSGQGVAYENKTYHFCQLLADLDANATASARIERWTSGMGFHATTAFRDITVEDFNGTKSCAGTHGVALEHPDSKQKKYIFMPWPLGCGSHIAGYDETKRQVLTHMPVSEGCCLRWENIVSCD